MDRYPNDTKAEDLVVTLEAFPKTALLLDAASDARGSAAVVSAEVDILRQATREKEAEQKAAFVRAYECDVKAIECVIKSLADLLNGSSDNSTLMMGLFDSVEWMEPEDEFALNWNIADVFISMLDKEQGGKDIGDSRALPYDGRLIPDSVRVGSIDVKGGLGLSVTKMKFKNAILNIVQNAPNTLERINTARVTVSEPTIHHQTLYTLSAVSGSELGEGNTVWVCVVPQAHNGAESVAFRVSEAHGAELLDGGALGDL